ncbi:MAG: hypothetical protein V2J08_12765, partial [Desulfotignum sp.]|nr:hypothetical protein [Desulfotignum sp.]
YGQIFTSSLDVPSDHALRFTAHIQGRKEEILTQDSVGCGYASGYWQVNVGNFPTAWNPGDILVIHFTDTVSAEEAQIEIVL